MRPAYWAMIHGFIQLMKHRKRSRRNDRCLSYTLPGLYGTVVLLYYAGNDRYEPCRPKINPKAFELDKEMFRLKPGTIVMIVITLILLTLLYVKFW